MTPAGHDPDRDLRDVLAVDDEPGPARHLEAAGLRSLVGRALDEAMAKDGAAGNIVPLRRRTWTALQLAAAISLAFVGAAAATWVAVRLVREPSVEEPPSAAGAAATRSTTGTGRRRARAEDAAAAAVGTFPAVADAALPGLGDAAGTPAAEPSTDTAPSDVGAPPSPGRPVVPIPAAPRAVEDLLRVASEHRAARAWRDAERAYLEVIRRAPGTSASYVASVAAATLRLEKLGQPRGALQLFERALRHSPAGDLSEEARIGVVESWRALGDGRREAAAIADVLAHHPSTASRARLETRARELAGPSGGP